MIEHAETDEQIAGTFDVMVQLRPELVRAEYVPLIRSLMDSDGYRLVRLIDEGEIRSVAGYRIIRMLYRGRLLYLDDFITDARIRSRGYGTRLLTWLKDEARKEGCSELQLISRVVREQAGIALIVGVWPRLTAFASAALLAIFAIAISFGIKDPLDYSVFSASACALLLALYETRTSTTFLPIFVLVSLFYNVLVEGIAHMESAFQQLIQKWPNGCNQTPFFR